MAKIRIFIHIDSLHATAELFFSGKGEKRVIKMTARTPSGQSSL